MKRSRFQRALYWFCRNATLVYFKVGWRVQAIGRQNIPRTGGLIVSANHRSFADPPILGITLPRQVHFLAKRELFRFKPFGWLISNLNAHPLNRKGDVAAFRMAKQVLDDGGALIVFPEGRRIKTPGFGPAKAGVGMLAFLAKAPVLPAYIENGDRMTGFKKIRVIYGEPLRPEWYKTYEEMAEAVMQRIADLKRHLEDGAPPV